jgi:hypothetical protein
MRQTMSKNAELLTVQEHFDITGRGLVLLPDFEVPDGWKNRSEPVLGVCNFYVARVGGRVGRNSNRYCLGYSLRAGFVLTKTPDHCVPNFGHKKPQRARLRLARLKESLLSAGDFTSARWRVNRKRFGIWRCSSPHNKPPVPTRKGEAPLLAAHSRRWMTMRSVCVRVIALILLSAPPLVNAAEGWIPFEIYFPDPSPPCQLRTSAAQAIATLREWQAFWREAQSYQSEDLVESCKVRALPRVGHPTSVGPHRHADP